MIENKKIDDEQHTFDMVNDFIAPEIKNDQFFSCKADIYSLGKLISFIINEVANVDKIINKCMNVDENERPDINELIKAFFINSFDVNDEIIQNDEIM